MNLVNWFISICSIVLFALSDRNEASLCSIKFIRNLSQYPFYWGAQNAFRKSLEPKLITNGPVTEGILEEFGEIEMQSEINFLLDNSELVFGDALMDGDGDLFFFLEKNRSNGILSVLIKASNGKHDINYHINEFFLVKKAGSKAFVPNLDYMGDPDVNDSFKVMQVYENYTLLRSNTTGRVFVSPSDEIDKTIRFVLQTHVRRDKMVELKRQEAEKKRILEEIEAKSSEGVTLTSCKPFAFEDEFLVSPDSVAYVARERSFIQQLFGQPASSELRNQFIHQKFISMLVKNELTLSDVMTIVHRAEEIFREEKIIGSIQIGAEQKLTVVGDIHGQLEDLLRIFKYTEWPSSKKMFLFNGDIVDRGSGSIECLLLIYVLKITFPHSIFVNRGNHESLTVATGTFHRDCVKFDRTGDLFQAFQSGFIALPISHVINERIYVVHGGIRADYLIKDLSLKNRFQMDRDTNDFTRISLWDDSSETNGLTANPDRGLLAMKFGPDVTESFLRLNEFDLLIRSHTYTPEGIVYEQGGKCYTVFSASNYLGRRNIGGVITFDAELSPEHIKYKPM